MSAYRTIGIDGGMMGPMTDETAVSAAAKAGVYLPSRVISDCITLPELAASARDQRVTEAQQPVHDAAAVHELRGEDEERNGEQQIARVHAVQELLGGGAEVDPLRIEVKDRAGD